MTVSIPVTLKTQLVAAGEDPVLKDLLEKIQSEDPAIRTQAIVDAPQVGPSAVVPAGELMTHENIEVGRAAKRAVWNIVRHSGVPGSGNTAPAVAAELLALLSKLSATEPKREVLWMISEVGGEEAVDPVAAYLANTDLREDARMCLERIPGEVSLAALQTAFDKSPEDFKSNLAQSLRARGVAVEQPPCAKLVPTKQTQVKPL
jgi:hypothetical protein